jgi:hypothetical protein
VNSACYLVEQMATMKADQKENSKVGQKAANLELDWVDLMVYCSAVHWEARSVARKAVSWVAPKVDLWEQNLVDTKDVMKAEKMESSKVVHWAYCLADQKA